MSDERSEAGPAVRKTDGRFRVLALDGGGAKGFYTLGVLREIEALLGGRLAERFDLIFGTSTGAIIAALLALGRSVDEVHDIYKQQVPPIMSRRTRRSRTAALARAAGEIFGEKTFRDVATPVGIVAAKWVSEKPMIFKSTLSQAHGVRATFTPGFGVTLADAVQASCSAFPFFDRKMIVTDTGDEVELIDGGYCANNPTLYAIADATVALGQRRADVRVANIGVGVYPRRKRFFVWAAKRVPFNAIELLQKTLEINTQSMDQLRSILFRDVPTIRISDSFDQPELATDLLEDNLYKLNLLRQRGRESYAAREQELKTLLF